MELRSPQLPLQAWAQGSRPSYPPRDQSFSKMSDTEGRRAVPQHAGLFLSLTSSPRHGNPPPRTARMTMEAGQGACRRGAQCSFAGPGPSLLRGVCTARSARRRPAHVGRTEGKGEVKSAGDGPRRRFPRAMCAHLQHARITQFEALSCSCAHIPAAPPSPE